MLANRRKRNSNTLLRAIDASENESLCSVFVEAFDLKDSFFVINENIFNLNHTYKVPQKPRKVKKNFQLFSCTILLPELPERYSLILLHNPAAGGPRPHRSTFQLKSLA